MSFGKTIKIAVLNLAIAIIDIMIFSPGLLNIEIGGISAFETAFGGTVIFVSVVVLIYGNYKLLIQRERVVPSVEIKNIEDCIAALRGNYKKKTFSKDITVILGQIERFNKKEETINDILLQKFNSSEMSYSKFKSVVNNVEGLIFINIKSILNRLNAFDEGEYKSINKKSNFTKEVIQTRKEIYNEYISFVKNSIEDNEEILLKMDKFLLEISKFNSLEDGEIENLSQMKEIDDLISKVKFYK